MEFKLEEALPVLERTPAVIRTLLQGLPEHWVKNNEGEGTWSPYDVVGHLIHGEKTDWITRATIILSDRASGEFEPFDRFAQFENSRDKSLTTLLDEFEELRAGNIEQLKSMKISPADLDREGLHPEFGPVSLKQLLSTWATHDLGHIVQISRTMARQYQSACGPWSQYLSVLS